MSDSNELRVNWFGCHLIWDSNDFRGCQLIWDSIHFVVSWFDIQMIWLSIDECFMWFWLSVDLNFKWCGCQLIWDLSNSVVNRFEIQMSWLSMVLRFKWFRCQLMCETKLGRSKMKLFCETSFKIETLKVKNKTFLQDFLQKWIFEAQKQNVSARLPLKLKLWSSKTKRFCKTSVKNESLKLKNQAFLRDFFKKYSFEAQQGSCSARLPQKWQLDQTLASMVPGFVRG